MNLDLSRFCKGISWSPNQLLALRSFCLDPRDQAFEPVSMGTFLPHCSLLCLCKNIFKGKWQSWAIWACSLSKKRCVPLGCAFGNGCLHTVSFHTNILASECVIAGNSLKGQQSLSFASCSLQSTPLACFGHCYVPAFFFFQNRTRLPLP